MNLKIAALAALFTTSFNYGMSFDVDGKPIIDKTAYVMEKQSVPGQAARGFVGGTGFTGAALAALIVGGGGFNSVTADDVKGISVFSVVIGALAAACYAYSSSKHNKVCDATNGRTLHGAVADNNVAGVKEYLYQYDYPKGSLSNQRDKNGYSPVQVAAATGSSQALQVLLESGLKYKGEYRVTADSENLSITLELSKQPVRVPAFADLIKESASIIIGK